MSSEVDSSHHTSTFTPHASDTEALNSNKGGRSPTSSPSDRLSKDGTLLLPKFAKTRRVLNHSDHAWCCTELPPGRPSGPNNHKIPEKNQIGLHGFVGVNLGSRDHMEDRHRFMCIHAMLTHLLTPSFLSAFTHPIMISSSFIRLFFLF